ncbi:MAG: hypothetical protein IAB80_03660 [Bacteroidetes bacterium]|uniref:Uncharacterized protein n=1 Tax=Candidatus Cryptobacteroides excrementipullorum TaxID=2840761 RepID=A0A9D9IU26_9BACT|nr:hypothetical protein [Candidatus Cryptobacteroides excrementipullorum]
MACKDSFDIGRFGRFLSFELKETVRENGLFILLAGLVPLMLLIVTFLFSLTYNPERIGEVWSGYAGLKAFVATVAIVLFLLIFPILKYGDITDRRKGQMPLMLPSSHAEKACSAFLVSVIIVPAVFMLLYFGTDALLCAVFPECGKSLAGYYARTGLIDSSYGSFNINCTFAFFLPPMVSLAGLAGGALFKKHKITKTFFSCSVAFILFMMTMVSIIDSSEISIEQIRNNFEWFWYTVQTVTAAGFGFYYWKRTASIEL